MNDLILNQESLTKNANTVKEIVLYKLYDDNIITKKIYNLYNEDYQVIIINPNWFIRWMEKYKIKKTELIFKLVKFKNNDK